MAVCGDEPGTPCSAGHRASWCAYPLMDPKCSGLFFFYFGLTLWHPRWLSGKRICLPMQETQEIWVQFLEPEDSLKEEMATHSSILASESLGQRSPVGYSPQGHK